MLYITSFCSRNKSIVHAVEELAEFGFKNIELTGGTKYEHFSEKRLFELKDRHDLNFLIHNYFPPRKDEFVLNLASWDEGIRSQTFCQVETAVKMSRKFGQNLYSLHAGYAYDQIPEKGEEGLFIPASSTVYDSGSFYDALDYIIRNILPNGFKLAVENAFPGYGISKRDF
ncbi:MAG: hypothetical protein GY795_38190 [Desulfobacterales bacterium]|nr:hypothetical protein [Desulfobacterales bacterium]